MRSSLEREAAQYHASTMSVRTMGDSTVAKARQHPWPRSRTVDSNACWDVAMGIRDAAGYSWGHGGRYVGAYDVSADGVSMGTVACLCGRGSRCGQLCSVFYTESAKTCGKPIRKP